ncbi:hypothetical protein [Cellulosimicrobium sp. NPDC057862]|uniref:phage tail tube protein n=1 Tax=Actinomycetes TaxID=1760 RepID=UPI00366C0D03
MVALPATDRFFQPEISKVLFALAIANPAAITRAEITAATDLTNEIADMSGWNVASSQINTPDLGNRFVSTITGRTQADNSTLTVYADLTGDDARKVLPRGTKGFLIFADGGDVEDQPCDIFPIEVASVGKVRSTGDQAFQLTIGFAIKKPPFEDVPLPAAA